MSGREVFEGDHERMGAHVIENAKLAQPPPPRAGPNRRPRAPLEVPLGFFVTVQTGRKGLPVYYLKRA
eukprot:4484191-Prymnesium_polylepis.1